MSNSWFYKEIVESIEEAIFVTDLSINIIYANKAAEKLFGYSKEELIGQHPSFLSAEKEAQKIRAEIEKTIRSNNTYKGFQYKRKKNGEIFIVEMKVSPLYNDSNEIVGYLAIHRNATSEKTIEKYNNIAMEILKLLNEKDSKKDVVYEIIKTIKKYAKLDSIGIRLKDGDDFPYYTTIGFDDKFVIQENFLCSVNPGGNFTLDCICGKVLGGDVNLYCSCFTGGGSFWTNDIDDTLEKNKDLASINRNTCREFNYKSMALIPLKSGKEIIGLLQLNGKSKDMLNGGFIAFLEGMAESIGVAISNRTQMEQIISSEKRLRDTAQALREKNRELEQFAYIASHDLQEPLRIINIYSQFLHDKCKSGLDEEGERYFTYLSNSVTRMITLIRELLDFSRVGRKDKPFEEINLSEILSEIQEDLALSIKENNASIIIDQEMPVINGVKIRIRQLFYNLISNSLKFRSETRDPIINIGCCEDESCWLFYVKDNGIGIEKKYYDRVFEIFKRLYSREKYPGTGIGLALCQRIVETHGGKIWIDSIPAEETTFYFTISKSIFFR